MTRRWIFPPCLSRLSLSAGLACIAADPVINEIHYDPPQKTDPAEFVEIFNPDAAAIDLSGWRLEGAVSYAFPADVILPGGGYLVIAQDPAFLKSQWNVDALGPWTGRLANEGDVLELRDPSGGQVDSVGYHLGFPWPTVGDPPGLSIELINPALDNDLGGNWRASSSGGPSQGSTVLETGQVWQFHRGTSPPSDPPAAWRTPAFDDSAWEQGPLPIGYDPAIPMGTPLDDMRGGYTSVFLRRHFQIDDPTGITSLRIEAQYDDGFRVWLNGQEILNVNLPDGELPFDGSAGPARESADFESFAVSLSPGWILGGDNVLAVQAHNASLSGSSDFYFDARVVAVRGPSGLGPTPGRLNVSFSTNAPPAIRQVDHSPNRPVSGEPVRLTAKITDPDGIESVSLAYQVVDPGAYIELTDPSYDTDWVTLPMHDDGLDGDDAAGDSIFTATLPGRLQVHRRLVRYRVSAVDRAGAGVRVPYPDDPEPNFAYFVYDGVPAWTGAVRPGAGTALGEVFTVDAREMNRLPVLHLIAKRGSVETATWFSRYGGDAYPWTGTLVFNGKVYDHVHYRARGGIWRYAMCKNMWKFDLNRGHDFEACDDWGRPLPTRWRKVNLGASIQQGDFNHRGEQGMFESVGFRVFRLAGVPAVRSAYLQFRIVDEDAEAFADDPYRGDFWGVYLLLEQPDGRFLEGHDLPDGNFYKMEGGTGELNNLGPVGPADKSDLKAFLSDYNGADENWWRASFDVDNYLSYQTVVQAIHHYDICADKNFFYYLNPENSKWQVVPWDLDLTWAENMYNAGCGGVDRIKERLLPDPAVFPDVWRQWQNRIREFRDLFWNQDEAWRLIDESAGRLRGPATGPTLLDADRAQWDYNPRMTNFSYSSSPSSKAGWGRFYRWPDDPVTITRDFDGCIRLMKDYVTFRASDPSANPANLDSLAEDPSIPDRPRIEYLGPTNHPVDVLRFQCSPYQGTAGFGTMKWRVGEITSPAASSTFAAEPWKYEIQPAWESGSLSSYSPEITLPAGALQVGHTYRARVQFADAEGRASHWSEPVQFVSGQAGSNLALVSSLRVTELMYNSVDGAENDFVELHNAGTAPLSLAGVAFTDAITYTFPPGAVLGAGGYLLVVRAGPSGNFAAFRTLYRLSTDVPVFGPYSGNLSDGGERVELTSAGGGTVILRVTYSDARGWPIAADGAGHSLVPQENLVAAGSSPDFAGSWRASTYFRGSPGRADPLPEQAPKLNEVVAHTDFLSEFDSNDWVELYQAANTPFVFGAGWYLSDDPKDLQQWQIPAGTTVPAHGFRVFDEVTGFNDPRGSGFSLNKAGEQVFLSHFPADGPGGVVDAVAFKGQLNDWSLARVPDGADFWDQVAPRTRASANASIPARVAISEILYHEGGLPTNSVPAEALEFIELVNDVEIPVRLANTNGTWRLNGGVSFDFPASLTLARAERLVVVSFDPADTAMLSGFRETFDIPDSVRIVGPYSGRLDNDQDRVALEAPQAPDVAGDPISWVIVDEVLYSDRPPWPADADGEGRSLNRTQTSLPGNDPSNWTAAPPTPGYTGNTGPTDGDHDGMPDSWEAAHGLNPLDPADAATDADEDGLSNVEEYLAGTDPRDATSSLRIISLRRTGDHSLQLSFITVAAHTYVVETSGTAQPEDWSALQSVPVAGPGGVMNVEVEVQQDDPVTFLRVRLQ